MDATRNTDISSLHLRQIALLEVECNRCTDHVIHNFEWPQPVDIFRTELPSAITPICVPRRSLEIIGSTALETPTVEPAPRYATPKYGPIGAERHFSRSSNFFQLLAPSTHFLQTFQPIPRHPNITPSLEAALLGVNDSGLESPYTAEETRGFKFIQYSDSNSGASDRQCYADPDLKEPFRSQSPNGNINSLLGCFGWDSPESRTVCSETPRTIISPFRPLPRAAPVERTPSRLTSVPLGASLFHCISSQLSQLDGTTYMQIKIWEELCMLSFPGGFSECLPVLVECLIDQGITRGFPSNLLVADFCAFLLRRVSSDSAGSGDSNIPSSYEANVRLAFLSIFKQSWTPLPKPGSLSSKFLLRVASFYGHLYLTGVLLEQEYRSCINFLSTLTPLPRNGLKALLLGNIEGHWEIPI